MDKDFVCWPNHEPCHMEIGEPRMWTLAVHYIKRLSKQMQAVESGSQVDDMA